MRQQKGFKKFNGECIIDIEVIDYSKLSLEKLMGFGFQKYSTERKKEFDEEVKKVLLECGVI